MPAFYLCFIHNLLVLFHIISYQQYICFFTSIFVSVSSLNCILYFKCLFSPLAFFPYLTSVHAWLTASNQLLVLVCFQFWVLMVGFFFFCMPQRSFSSIFKCMTCWCVVVCVILNDSTYHNFSRKKCPTFACLLICRNLILSHQV